MTATASTLNGRPQRKLLSEELDRLDSIIDSLAEGLPAAVAEAAREGTRAAVKDAIVEILTNPELRGLLQSTAPPPVVPSADPPAIPTVCAPPAWERLKSRIAAARTGIVSRYRAVRTVVSNTKQVLSSIMPLRRIVCVALGVGVAFALIGYIAPAGVAAVLAGVGGVVTAAVAQVGSWFRRSLNLLRSS